MDTNTAKDGNTPKALEPIQRATVEEILELYPDHPQASAMLFNHYNNAPDCHAQSAIFRQIMTLADYYRDRPFPLALLQDRVENDIYDGYRGIRQAAVEAIGKYYHDDPQTYSWLCDRAQNFDNAYVRQAAVEAIGKYYQDNPQTYSWLCDRYQNDEEAAIRLVALRQIAQHSPNNPQTIALLHDALNNTSESKYIREEALLQIAEHYHDDPQTLPLLQDWLQREQGILVEAVLIALAKYYKDNPKTVPILHEYARQSWKLKDAVRLLLDCSSHPETFAILRDQVQSTFDENSSYDYAAFTGFVKGYHEHPQTLSILMEVIQKQLIKYRGNLKDSVAQFVLNLLMEYYPEHPETLPFLISSVERSNDTFSETERRMINLLVRHYRDDPRVLPFLKQIAQNHSSSYLRTAALCNMAWGYGSNPETLSFLQQCIQAEQGCDDPIRIWDVMRTIGNGCVDNPRTLPWLKELAHDTGNNKLRNAAIEVLGEHFLSDPETYQLLSDIARNEPDEEIRLNTFRAIAKHDAQTNSVRRSRAVGIRPDESETLPDISIEIPEIPADCDSDYTRLCELLKAQLWRQAESVTYALIREKLGRRTGSVIRLEEVLTLSSEVLQTLDRLWTSTSCGHFGFSIQRKIYLQCGGTLDGKYPGDEVWQAFCQRVGWIVAGFLGEYGDIKFHLSAPAGHLPLWANVGEFGDCRYEYIFSDRKPPEIDYTKLRNLLAAGQWKEADYETYLLMLQIVGREPGEKISKDELSCFPCTELQTIDQLWIDASQGRFGFSIQKDIYLQSGGSLDAQSLSTEVWREFNRRVGWYVEDSGIWYEDLTFSIEAPVGHLPTPCWQTYYSMTNTIIGVIGSGLYDCIFPRIEACRT